MNNKTSSKYLLSPEQVATIVETYSSNLQENLTPRLTTEESPEIVQNTPLPPLAGDDYLTRYVENALAQDKANKRKLIELAVQDASEARSLLCSPHLAFDAEEVAALVESVATNSDEASYLLQHNWYRDFSQEQIATLYQSAKQKPVAAAGLLSVYSLFKLSNGQVNELYELAIQDSLAAAIALIGIEEGRLSQLQLADLLKQAMTSPEACSWILRNGTCYKEAEARLEELVEIVSQSPLAAREVVFDYSYYELSSKQHETLERASEQS